MAHDDLDRICLAKVGRVEAVPRRQHLVDEQGRGLPFLGGHPPVAGGGGGAHGRSGTPEGVLGRGRQGPEAHAGDGDGYVQLERAGPVSPAQNGARLAPLSIALQRIAGDGGGEEYQIVEVRHLPPRPQSPDRVEPAVRHLVDPSDHGGGEVGVWLIAHGGLVRSHQ